MIDTFFFRRQFSWIVVAICCRISSSLDSCVGGQSEQIIRPLGAFRILLTSIKQHQTKPLASPMTAFCFSYEENNPSWRRKKKILWYCSLLITGARVSLNNGVKRRKKKKKKNKNRMKGKRKKKKEETWRIASSDFAWNIFIRPFLIEGWVTCSSSIVVSMPFSDSTYYLCSTVCGPCEDVTLLACNILFTKKL